MSKKRNQVLFTKPEDPKFLKLIKQQIGYQEGPNIDAKRPKLDEDNLEENDISDTEEEKPQVCVIKSGDLTAEEAERERIRIETENNTKPADLSERIIFKSKLASKSVSNIATASCEESQSSSSSNNKLKSSTKSDKVKNKSKEKNSNKNKLSFNDEEDDDQFEE